MCKSNAETQDFFSELMQREAPTSGVFSRMRSEGFSFNSGGLGVESCSRSVASMFATVRNRPQSSATVRNRPQ